MRGEGITTYHLLFSAEYIEVINGRVSRFPRACGLELSPCIRHTRNPAWARPYHWARREFEQMSAPWHRVQSPIRGCWGGVLQTSAVPSAACSALRSTDLASRPLCLGQRFSPYRPQLATRAAPPSNPWLVFSFDFVLICLQPQGFSPSSNRPGSVPVAGCAGPWIAPTSTLFAAASLAVFCTEYFRPAVTE